MNNFAESPVDQEITDRLLKQLSRLQPSITSDSIDPGIKEKLLRDLHKQRLEKSGRRQHCQLAIGDYWEVVLISIFFPLLGWDLFCIIRLLLK